MKGALAHSATLDEKQQPTKEKYRDGDGARIEGWQGNYKDRLGLSLSHVQRSPA